MKKMSGWEVVYGSSIVFQSNDLDAILFNSVGGLGRIPDEFSDWANNLNLKNFLIANKKIDLVTDIDSELDKSLALISLIEDCVKLGYKEIAEYLTKNFHCYLNVSSDKLNGKNRELINDEYKEKLLNKNFRNRLERAKSFVPVTLKKLLFSLAQLEFFERSKIWITSKLEANEYLKKYYGESVLLDGFNIELKKLPLLLKKFTYLNELRLMWEKYADEISSFIVNITECKSNKNKKAAYSPYFKKIKVYQVNVVDKRGNVISNYVMDKPYGEYFGKEGEEDEIDHIASNFKTYTKIIYPNRIVEELMEDMELEC